MFGDAHISSLGYLWRNHLSQGRKCEDLYGEKPIVSVTYENESLSIKNSLPYIKWVLLLSCVVHGPIYGRFIGCTGEHQDLVT